MCLQILKLYMVLLHWSPLTFVLWLPCVCRIVLQRGCNETRLVRPWWCIGHVCLNTCWQACPPQAGFTSTSTHTHTHPAVNGDVTAADRFDQSWLIRRHKAWRWRGVGCGGVKGCGEDVLHLPLAPTFSAADHIWRIILIKWIWVINASIC